MTFLFFFFHLFSLVGGQPLYNIVVAPAIHGHESAMDLHVFPIPIPPPTSHPTPARWVFPVHQPWALVSCIQPGLVICLTFDNIHVSMLCSQNILKYFSYLNLVLYFHILIQKHALCTYVSVTSGRMESLIVVKVALSPSLLVLFCLLQHQCLPAKDHQAHSSSWTGCLVAARENTQLEEWWGAPLERVLERTYIEFGLNLGDLGE